MTTKELRKIILDSWGDLNDANDKIDVKDLIELIDDYEELLEAAKAVYVLSGDLTPGRKLLKDLINKRGRNEIRIGDPTTDSN